ncbi:MAG TPA: diguanylate cyclase [Candidatus Nanoarchaeia archaeon]|nr:diguanylate cyclase [Candidatus Nanoarchaeia archaeon]
MTTKLNDSLDLLLRDLEKRAFAGRISPANIDTDLTMPIEFMQTQDLENALLSSIICTLDGIYRAFYDGSGVVLQARQYRWEPEELGGLKKAFIASVVYHSGLLSREEALLPVPIAYHFLVANEKTPHYLIADELPLAHRRTAILQLLRRVQDSIILELVDAAVIDGLTGLHNQRFFDGRLPEELRRAHRYHHQLTLVLVDMNDLKKINDSYGHDFGNRMLRETGKALRFAVREADTVYRLGGDEFAVLMPHMDESALRDKGPVLQQSVDQHLETAFHDAVPNISLFDHPPTVSIGAAVYPLHALDVAAFRRAADMATYHAKLAAKLPDFEEAKINQLLRMHGLSRPVLDRGFHMFDPALNGSGVSFYAGIQTLLGEKGRGNGK